MSKPSAVSTINPTHCKKAFLSVTTDDGHTIALRHWSADQVPVRACLMICHGMGEHADRYDALAQALSAKGIACFAHDHRGHGPDTETRNLGHYADQDGWDKVTHDVALVRQKVSSLYPGLPCFILGHSMGSFITQGYMQRHGHQQQIAGMALSASNRDLRARIRALRLVLRAEKMRCGPRGTSKVLDALTFGAFAKTVKNARTPYDWLSRNHQEVDLYMQDPACGFSCTTQLWDDLSLGLLEIGEARSMAKIPNGCPIFLLSGEADPVGSSGKGPRRLASAYLENGKSNVRLRVYPGVRHEPFHEINAEQITQDLLAWIEQTLTDQTLTELTPAGQ